VVPDAGAGQVDDSVGAVDHVAVEAPGAGVPAHIALAGVTAHQPNHVVTAVAKVLDERRPDQSR
jgi:hypothetical protein